MTRVPLVAASLLTLCALAIAEEPDGAPATPCPQLELKGDVRITIEGGDTSLLATLAASGQHMLVCFAPRADAERRCDTWTGLSLIDLRKAEVTGSWGAVPMQPMGRLGPVFSPDGHLFAWGTRKDAETLKVNVRAAVSRRGTGTDVPHAAGSRGYAEVAALSGNAQRVAIREPANAEGRRDLIVYELAGFRQIARYVSYGEPQDETEHAAVVLTGPRIAFHARPAEGADSGAHRLLVVELDNSRTVAERTACASRSTAGYAFTRDLARLVNVSAACQVEVVDLTSGDATALIDAKELSGHPVDLLLSGDGKRAVAWSDECNVVLARDLDGGAPLRVELPYRADVLGTSADGRWVYVRAAGRGLVAVDLAAGKEAGVLAGDLADWVRITPDGAYAIEGVRDDGGWTFAIFAIKTP